MIRYKCPACGGNQYTSSPNITDDRCIYCGNIGIERMNSLEEITAEQKSDEGRVST